MFKYTGTATDSLGNAIVGALVSAKTPNVTSPLPPIYSDNGDGTTTKIANPLVIGKNGEFTFLADVQNLTVSVNGYPNAIINMGVSSFSPSSTASTGARYNSQSFTSNAGWTAPAGVFFAKITCVGAGGGGQAGKTSSLTTGTAGKGGGAGATVTRLVPVVPGVTYAIVIGQGGTGGVPSLGLGTDGGNTSFGSLVTAYGGKANGIGGLGTTLGYGGGSELLVVENTYARLFYGDGGIAAGGDGGAGGNNSGGLSGSKGIQMETYLGGFPGIGDSGFGIGGGGGGGGSTPYGNGGNGGAGNGSGAGGNGLPPAIGYGGGGGAGGSGSTLGGSGGAGANGYCIVEWTS